MSGQDFGASRHVTARKQHQCEECRRWINQGERYQRHAGSWEGDFFTWVSCRHCVALRAILDKVDNGFYEGAFGGVGEWFAQGMILEYAKTFEEGLRLTRLRHQFTARWHTPTGELYPAPTTDV